MATKCSSITSLNSGNCPGKRIPMGFACPGNAKGNYFLKTKRSNPFGEQGLKKSEINCENLDVEEYKRTSVGEGQRLF